MGWGSEQITGILGSILGAIGDKISGIGEKFKETAEIIGISDENPDKPKKFNASSPKSSNDSTKKGSTTKTAGSSSSSNTSNKTNCNSNTNRSNNKREVYQNNVYLKFGEPRFSVYDQGIRGIAFPYLLRIQNRPTTPIVVTAKFCKMDGTWVKTNVTELSDNYGDAFIKESLFVDSNLYEKESYLFLPYGVLKLDNTQQICLNFNVVSRRGSGQTLLRFSYRFEYFIYPNDPREPQRNASYKAKQSNFSADYFGQPGVDELLGLIAHVIKADGLTNPEEIRTVIEFFDSSPHLDKNKIKERLKYYLANLPSVQSCCQALREYYNTQGLLTFVGLFLNIAISDGKTPYVELKIIEEISNCLKIPQTSYRALKDSFIPRSRRTSATSFDDFKNKGNGQYSSYNSSDTSNDGFYDASDNTGKFHKTNANTNANSYSYTHNSSTYKGSYSSSSSYSNPLWKMFNLPSTSTKAELKKAYFEKCKLFHPDKYANAPESKRKEAEELFKNYQAAYEELLKEF